MAQRFTPALYTGRSTRGTPRQGGWGGGVSTLRTGLTAEQRAAKGRNYLSNVIDAHAESSQDRAVAVTRSLTATQIRTIYEKTPDIRACVDTIVRRVATAPWVVEPAEEVWPSHPKYEEAQEAAAKARRFLKAPSLNPLTAAWQPFMVAVLTDLLLYDFGVWENVEPVSPSIAKTKLAGLLQIRGSAVEPKVDDTGSVTKYVQHISGRSGERPEFEPDDLCVLQLFPNTISPYGTPIIETLLNEIITLLMASERAMTEMDSNEIPPGILFIAGMGHTGAKQLEAKIRNEATRSDRLHMAYGDDIAGDWVELRRKFKDVEFAEVIKEVQRCVWRAFGLSRTEMGDTENANRAVSEVQERAQQSGLIAPILQMVAGTINARLLPLLIEDEEVLPLVQFRFDMERELTAEEGRARAEGLKTRVTTGLLTINEARAEEGKPPLTGGDVPMVLDNGMWVPLALVAARAALPDDDPGGEGGAELPPDDPDGEPDDGDDPPDGDASSEEEGSAEANASDEDDDAPGESGRSHGEGCDCPAHRSLMLPSEWPSAATFDGYRTLPLRKLAALVDDYERAVRPLYQETTEAVRAHYAAAYAPGEMSAERGQALNRRVQRELERLERRWSLASEDLYRQAGAMARDTVRDWTGSPTVLEDAEDRALDYFDAAMGYLAGDGGLIASIRDRLRNVLVRITRSAEASDTRGAADSLNANSEPAAVQDAVGEAFTSQRGRIANWTGKLVELASKLTGDGLTADTLSQWYVEWVDVGDDSECPDCMFEGSQGFRQLRRLTRMPGGDTQCQGRCRCVLVFWRKAEVEDGTAVLLGGGNTGEPL